MDPELRRHASRESRFLLLGMIACCGVLAGCAPHPRVTVTAPPMHGQPASTSLLVAGRDAAPGSHDAEEGMPAEQAELDAPGGLHAVVRWHRLTGQTHVADELTLTTAGGTLRFEPPPPGSAAPGSEDVPPDYPLVERILPAGTGRWVALGWSSHSEGMETVHAWLIEDHGGPKLLDSLAWTTDRGHAGVAVDASATQVRIGIPLPEMTDPDGGTAIHQAGAWMLEHGTQQLDLDELLRLPFSETHVMALRDYYDPPFQYEPSRRHWSGRFVWFSAGARFALDSHPDAAPATHR
jgi:hypothetical protein